MDVIFMGTPDFSVPTLETLIQSEHRVVAVVTRPDKPKGRSGKLQFPPVKEKALAYGIPVLQPVKVKDEAFIETLRSYRPDVIIVVAYGGLLPERVLNMPKYGCINVHASLLPKYRGAAPIAWTILNGEKESGVTIMKMDQGIDTGNILMKRSLSLSEDETSGSLHDKLSVLGGPMILKTLEDVKSGNIQEEKQKDEDSSYAKMLDKQMGKMDFHQSAVRLERLVRALNPWPSAYMRLNGKIIKIWKAKAIPTKEKQGEAGEVVFASDEELHVQTGEGILSLKEVQMEGKKQMPVDVFLRGCKVTKGMRLT